MIFVKHYLSVQFFQFDFVDYNIVKFYISNINLLCATYKSSGTDSDYFTNTISKVIDECIINNESITGDMN